MAAAATVALQLQVVIAGVGPPFEIGTVEVEVGAMRGQLSALLREVADEIDNGTAYRPRYVLGLGQVDPDEEAGRAVPPVVHDRDGPADPRAAHP